MLKRAPSCVSVCLTQSLLASLLSLTLVLAPPAFADDESATTCGVDVVFLIDTGGSAVGGFARIEELHRTSGPDSDNDGGHSLAVATRGNAKAIIDALSGEGADIRFAIADYIGDPAEHHEAGHYGKQFGRPKLLDDPKKTSADSLEQRLFVADTESFQVQRFRNPRGLSRTDHSRHVSSGPNSPDNTTPESFGRGRSWGGGGEASESEKSKAGGWFGENEFGRAGPNGIAIDSQRNFYALDAGSSRVQKFSSFGLFITQWGGKGSRPGEFYYGKDHGGPMGIAMGPHGNVFITDQGNFRVQIFSRDGDFRSEFGTEGTGDGQFLKPTHVAVDSKGNVYVTDWKRRDVQKFVSSASGYEWALTFGGKETVAHEQGLFYAKADGYGPNGIAVNSKDLIHVSDSGNCRVQVFDSGGVFQHQIPAAHYTPAKVLAKRKRDKEYLISKVVKKAKSKKEGNFDYIVKNAKGGNRYWQNRWLSEYKKTGGTLTGDAIFTDAAIKEVMTTLVNDRKWYADNYWQHDFDKHKDWLPNVVMAELYGAARPAGGGSVGKPTAPVDVCNTFRASQVGYEQYETHVNFSGPIPGKLPKWTKAAQPEYPASKWVGPGAIAIGNNDEVFVVDAPYADSTLSTTMSIKQFSASGEYMGLVLKSGRYIPSLPGIAMWRNRGTAPSKMALDPLRKLEYARSAYRVAKQFMPPERRHGLRDEDIATTALETTVRQHQFRSGADNGGLFALHQLATDGSRAPGKGYFSCWASATPPGTREERAKACPSAIGWRESKDIARVIVWYGSQASHTVSVDVDQAIAALKENDITVAAVNLFIGQRIRSGWALERQFGHWYGPQMNNDYFSKRGVGIDCPDPTLPMSFTWALEKTCPFGGVVDGDGQATRIIDATGGVYQHLFEGDHQGNAESVRKYWNDGKGVYGPTLKFILDQFSPPPMAGSSVPVTVSNDGKTLYVAKFNDGKATGDLEAWSLSAASIPTSVKWRAAKKLDARSRLASKRNALTYSGGRGVKMEWNRLSVDQKADFLVGRSAEATDQARLKFLLGDRSKEGGEFHTRSSVLGPIARSAPVYVGAPNQTWLTSVGGSAYAAFLKKAAKRKAMVYVGSNGGALHGFDAVTGEETLAYYPGALYRTGHGGYHDLALAGFTHKTKYVDGVPSVSDVKVDRKWRTVLVSSLGGGGRGLFALDVTKPSDLSDASKTVLWEFTHEDDPHLGETHSKPILRQMNNGKWAAIIGNGQGGDAADATAGQAQLFIVYLDGPGGDGVWDLGKDYLRISTGEGTSDERNALFSPIGIDHDVTPDGRFDVIYAGDLYGNLWRFDVSGSTERSWSSPAKPFFKGDKTRPITATPAVGIAPAGVTDLAPIRTGALEKTHPVMVFFGSGRLLADADKAASIVNRFYGVYDDGSKLGLTEADLTVQQRTYSTPTARVYQNDLEVGYTRSTSGSKRGWYITLPDDGERVIDRALVKGELVYFNTVIPDTTTCDAGGKGWENVVQMSNGGSAKGAQWDVNQNGSLDAGDTHAGLSFAGRKTATGQPGAPKIIGGQLFSPRTYKVGTAKGPRDHFKNKKIASASSSSTSGRLSWMELQPRTD